MDNISKQYVAAVAALDQVPISFEVLAEAGRCFDRMAPVQPARDEAKMCYSNAAWLARTSGRMLHYVEGYAVSGQLMMPLAHAWCVDDAGQVYDSTWRDGHDYFGMVFDHDKVEDLRLLMKMHGIFENLIMLRHLDLEHVRHLLLDAALSPFPKERP